VELGIGAGWKQDEWESYGYGFPAASERLAILSDHLEIITRMLQPGPVTFEGQHASVRGALHEPVGLQQPRIPVVVGGNGPNVTWRLAARFADELNLDAMPPADVERALPVIRSRCEEIGRDPSTLRVSVHIWGAADAPAGPARRDRLRAYADLGLARAIVQGFAAVSDPGHLETTARDAAAAGLLGGVAA
jgi:alkanesulfonate monooxygenase SsuD/methylene tetrahydromethanopterin reductase-like flavin-dependent oxidoreductase (luciferase family)